MGTAAALILAPAVTAAIGACAAHPRLTLQERSAIEQMRRALDAVRRGEAHYYLTAGQYTTDATRLSLQDLPGRVALRLEYATTDSYVATATHPDVAWICALVQRPDRPYAVRCEQGKEPPPGPRQ